MRGVYFRDWCLGGLSFGEREKRCGVVDDEERGGGGSIIGR